MRGFHSFTYNNRESINLLNRDIEALRAGFIKAVELHDDIAYRLQNGKVWSHGIVSKEIFILLLVLNNLFENSKLILAKVGEKWE